MKTIKIITLSLAALILIGAEGCEEASVDSKQSAQNERMVAEAHSQIGMPEITQFTERRLFKEILEQRDQTFSSFTYVRNMDGRPVLFCRSIGYGLPAATQFTNPSRTSVLGNDRVVLPQADPNGMFMPSSSDATYVLCVNSSADGYDAQYIEDRITVTTHPLQGAITSYSMN